MWVIEDEKMSPEKIQGTFFKNTRNDLLYEYNYCYIRGVEENSFNTQARQSHRLSGYR